jgi:hypothetical protein
MSRGLNYELVQQAPPWLTLLFLGFPCGCLEIHPTSDHVGFVADKAALRRVFSKYFGFPLKFQ